MYFANERYSAQIEAALHLPLSSFVISAINRPYFYPKFYLSFHKEATDLTPVTCNKLTHFVHDFQFLYRMIQYCILLEINQTEGQSTCILTVLLFGYDYKEEVF